MWSHAANLPWDRGGNFHEFSVTDAADGGMLATRAHLPARIMEGPDTSKEIRGDGVRACPRSAIVRGAIRGRRKIAIRQPAERDERGRAQKTRS